MLDCLSFKPSNRPSFAEVVKRIAIMQQELRTGRPMTGVAAKGGDDGGLMKGRLFRDSPKVKPGQASPTRRRISPEEIAYGSCKRSSVAMSMMT